MEDVMPKKNDTPNQQDKILDADIAMEEYLPMRRKEVPSQENKLSEQMFWKLKNASVQIKNHML